MGATEREKAKQTSRGFRCGKWGMGSDRAFGGGAPAHARHSHLPASLSSAPRARPLARGGGARVLSRKNAVAAPPGPSRAGARSSQRTGRTRKGASV